MKIFFRTLICLSLLTLPLRTQASIGDELNSLLERFFGEDSPAATNSPALQTIEIPDLPENLTSNDIAALREQIMFEETALEDFESELLQAQEALRAQSTLRTKTETDLALLDQEIHFTGERLQKQQSLLDKYRTQLELLTREKAFLSARLRNLQARSKQEQTRYALREGHFSAEEGDVPIVEWLFGTKTVSEILQDRQKNRTKNVLQSAHITELQQQRETLAQRERQMAELYAQSTSLTADMAQQKQNLVDFAEAKAQLRSEAIITEEELQQKRAHYRQQQTESTLLLQKLHQQLSEASSLVDLPSSTDSTPQEIFQPPLRGTILVETPFHDPDYQDRLGIVHDGVDLVAAQGTPVYAIGYGTVQEKGTDDDLGFSYVVVAHEKDTYSLYGHLSRIDVDKGQIVDNTVQLGLSGGTPGTKGAGFFTTGAHLHLEILQNGSYKDPMDFFSE